MAKILFMLGLLFAQSVTGQIIEPKVTIPQQELHDRYLMKYKTSKTAGWVLLGSGIGMILGGGIAFASYASDGFNGVAPVTAETLFIIVGPATALVSIPFFISAKRNKAKANLAIKGEVFNPSLGKPTQSKYTAVALTIPL